jgi:3-hydroxyisobutyrate dehydrogenase-like beta-hydroxyacid dehydrogenase
MGGPVAQRLVQSEFPLMVWDIAPPRRDPFENKDNVRIAPPGEMARKCSVLYSLLYWDFEEIKKTRAEKGAASSIQKSKWRESEDGETQGQMRRYRDREMG